MPTTNTYIDASALKLLHCERRFKWGILDGYHEENRDNVAMGNAVHHYAHVIELDPANQQAAIESTLSIYKGDKAPLLMNCIQSYEAKRKTLPPPIKLLSNEPAVEWYFEKAGENNITYCGTIDSIRVWGDCLAICDIKTTKLYDLAKFESKYYYDTQFLFYIWFLRKYGRDFLLPEHVEKIETNKIIGLVYTIGLTHTPLPKVRISEPIEFPVKLTDEFDSWMAYQVPNRIDRLRYEQFPVKEGLLYNTCNTHYCPFTSACVRDESFLSVFSKRDYRPSEFRKL
jgi:hypothetical protein